MPKIAIGCLIRSTQREKYHATQRDAEQKCGKHRRKRIRRASKEEDHDTGPQHFIRQSTETQRPPIAHNTKRFSGRYGTSSDSACCVSSPGSSASVASVTDTFCANANATAATPKLIAIPIPSVHRMPNASIRKNPAATVPTTAPKVFQRIQNSDVRAELFQPFHKKSG